MALKDANEGRAWTEWDDAWKFPTPAIKAAAHKELKDSVDYYCFLQYIFFKQWDELKNYAHKKGVRIISGQRRCLGP